VGKGPAFSGSTRVEADDRSKSPGEVANLHLRVARCLPVEDRHSGAGRNQRGELDQCGCKSIESTALFAGREAFEMSPPRSRTDSSQRCPQRAGRRKKAARLKARARAGVLCHAKASLVSKGYANWEASQLPGFIPRSRFWRDSVACRRRGRARRRGGRREVGGE
jgi:hypothetical protein